MSRGLNVCHVGKKELERSHTGRLEAYRAAQGRGCERDNEAERQPLDPTQWRRSEGILGAQDLPGLASEAWPV